MTPKKQLYAAAFAGDAKAVATILKDRDPKLLNEWKPLMDACLLGHVPVVKALLRAGVDPNILGRNGDRYRPLIRAVQHRDMAPRDRPR